ncbi:MAG: hypothetical protein M1819_000658 [Sarea resinae]|nr:MAG: hypothetical protein M1819_000658 [Sarea resinae]
MQSLPNPCLIQSSPTKSTSALPLYLIHDGGGTIVQYYLLNPLSRPVYGIYNPQFESGGRWEGGIAAMAREYARLIAATQPRGGAILLGGWSLGGILSLEVARLLQTSPSPPASTSPASPATTSATAPITIAGLILIDSLCPNNRAVTASAPTLQFHARTNAQMRQLSQGNMSAAVEMLRSYTAPLSAAAWVSRPEIVNDSSNANTNDNTTNTTTTPTPAPHTILIRATDRVPASIQPTRDQGVDSTRDTKRALGWEDGEMELVRTVLDVPGHHFDIFDDEHIDALSKQLALACSLIEHSLDE